MVFMTRFFLVTLALLAGSVAHAGVWGERGHPQQILVRGAFAYAADGRGVSVYDISDPADIQVVDVESRHAETVDAAWMGNDLVTATSSGVERFGVDANGGLTFIGSLPTQTAMTSVTASATWGAASSGRVVTLFQPTADGLQMLSTTTLPAPVLAIATVGSYLYVSVERQGTYVFLPPSMEQIAIIRQTATEFELAGNVLWGIGPAGGITEFDVSDPRAPRRTSYVASATLFDGLAVSGSRVYALQTPNLIQVYDASPPEPELIGSMSSPADTIAATGSLLLTSRSTTDGPGSSFAAPLRLFDASSPTPTFIGELTDYAGPVSGIWTDGSIAYVVDAPYLRVLDVSKTDEPREIRSILIPNIQDRIRVKNGLAILYGNAFVNLIDVTDPLNPQHVGTWDARGHTPSAAAIAAGRIIEGNNHSGLHIVDYSDPANAVQIGGRKWHYLDIAAADDVIYALQQGFFLVLQIVDGHLLVGRSSDTTPSAISIEIAPPNAAKPDYLLTRGLNTVRVYDLTDRFSPVLLGEIALDHPGEIGTATDVAYVAFNGTLHTIDLADPSGVTDTTMPVTSAMQISAGGPKVVVADRYRVRVFGPDTPSPLPRRRSVAR